MSVLEHLPDPLHALRWVWDRLKPDGKLLMRHPNFGKLPGDLFCADHISKMTVPHTRMMAESAGFKVLAENTGSVLFYFVLQKNGSGGHELRGCFEENLAIARGAESVAEATIQSVQDAVRSAGQKGRKAAVFGTAPIGSMAHLLLDCKQDIACFVDENKNNWGREIDGIAVVGPQRMEEMGVSDVALAISPQYWDAVGGRLKEYGVDVHTPEAGD
jgi:hypothetical protein